MEFIAKQENLLNALKATGRLSSARNTLAILSNTLIKIETDGATFTTTNLEAAISYKITGKVNSTGSITVPTKLMLDLVSTLPKGNIKLTEKEGKVYIETDGAEATINGMSAEEFPVVPVVDSKNKQKINAEEFKTALQKTINSSSKDDTRPVLNGVYLHSTPDGVAFAATDSYRLSECVSSINLPEGVAIVIPTQTAAEMISLLEGVDDAELVLDANQIQLETNNAILVSKLIDGNYPNYNTLIPENTEVEVSCSKQDLATAVKTAGIFSRDVGGSIIFEANSEGVNVKSTTGQLGDNNTLVDGDVVGEGLVSLNSRYMSEALATIDGQDIILGFSSSLSPIVVKGTADSNLTQLIMPLKS